jgi:hypothetical protein
MKTNFTKIFIVILTTIIFSSCKKYKDEYYGPGLGVAPDDFSASALVASNSNPNFASQTVFFQSIFNATVRWKLTLVGQTSGAVKVISGLSNSLAAANCVWNGSTDTLKLFRKNETVVATLTVLGWKDNISTSITIGGEKDRGIILGNFENITVDHSAKNWPDVNSLYWFYSFEPGEYDDVNGIVDPTAPQGNYILNVSGHDANSSYYIGQVGISAPAGVFNFGATTLNDFYFNIYVKGAGSAASNDYKFVMQTYEDDAGDGLQYNSSEDKFTYQISLQYNGWKLHQIKYSDFSLDAGSSASPYKDHSPDKIGNIGFFFGANTSAGLSSINKITFGMDYFSITTNGPMIP